MIKKNMKKKEKYAINIVVKRNRRASKKMKNSESFPERSSRSMTKEQETD